MSIGMAQENLKKKRLWFVIHGPGKLLRKTSHRFLLFVKRIIPSQRKVDERLHRKVFEQSLRNKHTLLDLNSETLENSHSSHEPSKISSSTNLESDQPMTARASCGCKSSSDISSELKDVNSDQTTCNSNRDWLPPKNQTLFENILYHLRPFSSDTDGREGRERNEITIQIPPISSLLPEMKLNHKRRDIDASTLLADFDDVDCSKEELNDSNPQPEVEPKRDPSSSTLPTIFERDESPNEEEHYDIVVSNLDRYYGYNNGRRMSLSMSSFRNVIQTKRNSIWARCSI
jgi:hypothetical protein